MRIVIVLLVAAIPLAFWMGERRGETNIDHASQSETFNLRSRCAELGERILKSNPASPQINPAVLSHYDSRTTRCYVELDNDYSRRVFDGQTGERLAELWNGPIPTAYLKGVQGASNDATRAFIDSHMADDLKK
jgi:hypothetical protein